CVRHLSSTVWLVSRRSPSTLTVSLPAERALTDTTMVSPEAYSPLSTEVSSRSGVSALPSEYQPTSNCTEVSGPSASVDLTSRRYRPGCGDSVIRDGLSAAMVRSPSATRVVDLTGSYSQDEFWRYH